MQLVTVIVAVFNEEEYLSTLIQRVMAADIPHGLEREIVIVDDGSGDGSMLRVSI